VSKATERLEVQLSTAVAKRDGNTALVARLAQAIEDAPDGPAWSDAIVKHRDADKAQAALIAAVVEAEQALAEAQNNEYLDGIVPTLAPLDQAIFDKLDALRFAAQELQNASQVRDSAAAAKAAGLTSSPRAQPDLRNPMVDGYRLSATRAGVIVEACRILAPVFQGLGNGYVAQQLLDVVRSGNRLSTTTPKETA
jgi:hypothetical protein